MDSFASVSGHVSTLMKQLGNEKIPSLHNRVLLPLQVTTDRDPELEVGIHTHTTLPCCSGVLLMLSTFIVFLQKVTEGRVQILHHELSKSVWLSNVQVHVCHFICSA